MQNNVFFEYLNQIIIESNEEATKNLLQNHNKLDFYDQIIQLDPTNGKTNSIKLAKFFVEPTSFSNEEYFNIIKKYFMNFSDLKRRQLLKGKESDINSFKSFNDFHNFIDGFTTEIANKKGVVLNTPTNPTPTPNTNVNPVAKPINNEVISVFGKEIDKSNITYQDDNVIVARADNERQSIKYGCELGPWCTARKSGNLFYTYRLDKKETLFYVYFLKKDLNNKESVLHFGINEENNISYTDRTNKESIHTLTWLIKKFPELEKAYKNNAFTYVPLSESEIKIRKLGDNITLEEFKRLNFYERRMWILSEDRPLKLDIFNELDNELKNIYVNSFKDREDDIDEDILESIKGSRFETTYWKNIAERYEEDEEITNHTLLYLKTVLSDEEFKKAINKLNDKAVFDLLISTKNVKEKAEILGKENINKLHNGYVFQLIKNTKNTPEMFNLLGKDNIDKLTNNEIYYLMDVTNNQHQLINLLGKDNIDKLTSESICELINITPELINLLGKDNVDKLTSEEVYRLIYDTHNSPELINLLGKDNVDKLDSYQIYKLIKYTNNKAQLFNLLGKNNINKLTDYNVYYLLKNTDNKAEMIKLLIQYGPKFKEYITQTFLNIKQENVFNKIYDQILLEAVWDVEIPEEIETSDFQQDLLRIYELEYKLFKATQMEMPNNPERLNNIIKQIKIHLFEPLINVKQVMENTLKHWLKGHAILDPKQWAETRVKNNENFETDDPDYMLLTFDNLLYEFLNYYSKRQTVSPKMDANRIFHLLFNNILLYEIDNIPKIKEILNKIMSPINQEMFWTEFNNDKKSFLLNYGLKTEDDVTEFIENYESFDMISDMFDKDSFIKLFEYEQELFNELIIEIYKEIVFPLWYEFWQKHGIDDTRENIENIYKNLINTKENINNLKELITNTTIALNATHQNGSILDYVNDDGKEDLHKFLDGLTDGLYFKTQSDKELKEVGISV